MGVTSFEDFLEDLPIHVGEALALDAPGGPHAFSLNGTEQIVLAK